MEFVKRIKFTDIIISSALSFWLTTIAYKFLYNTCRYSNLKDFYSGVSIYEDHNKYLDTHIYFLYLILFFIFTYILSFLGKTKPEKNTSDIIETKDSKIKNIFLKLQYIPLFGFLLINPINHNLYPKVLAISLILVVFVLIDVYKCQKKSTFSAFSISALLFIFFFYSNNIQFYPIDDHHFGETFATFFLHNNFNLQYYKDIMLIHGYIDVLPSWIGKYLFNTNTMYGYLLGETLYRNLGLIFLLISGCYIFKSNKQLIIPIVLLPMPLHCALFCMGYIILTKIQNVNIRFILYIIFSFTFCMLWTTIGSFWLLASLPLAFYTIQKKPEFKYILSGIILLIILILSFREPIFYYLSESKNYLNGFLYSFGNNFGNFGEINIFEYIYKIFALLFIPVLIIQLIKEYRCESRNTDKILFLVFAILFAIISLPYTLGRIDGSGFIRLGYISSAYIFIFLPYFILNFCSIKFIKISKIIYTAIIIFAIGLNITTIYNKVKYVEIKHIDAQQVYLDNLNEYFKKFDKNFTLFDMTNRGMNYLYLNKKCPVKYTSYYNSISSKQAENSLKRLKQNPPDVIIIYANNITHDNIYPSLRINPIYRWILLSGKYRYEKYKNYEFMVKEENQSFSKNDLLMLDLVLSNYNLKFLPEVWAKSIKKLPLKEIQKEFFFYTEQNKLTILFNSEQKGSDIDFIYLGNNIKSPSKYIIKINNSESELTCYSKTGKLLIPFDNYPSWILNDKIKTITIEAMSFNKPNIIFYNKIGREDEKNY